MVMLARFRDAGRPITLHTEQIDEWTQALTFEKPLPYVVRVTDLVLRQSEIVAGMLRINGYRAVDREPEWRVTRYVRPLPLWVVHWCGIGVERAFWKALGWLYRHHVIRLANEYGTLVRLRDLRPWPLKGRRVSKGMISW